jgi:hypothetical protein
MPGVAFARKRWAPGPNARVDWSHPLGAGLGFAWSAAAGAVDLVSGAPPTVNASLGTKGSGVMGATVNHGPTGYLQFKCAPWDDPISCLVVLRTTTASPGSYAGVIGDSTPGTRIRFGSNGANVPLGTIGSIADYTFSSLPTIGIGNYVVIYQLTSTAFECHLPGASQTLAASGMTANGGDVLVGTWANPAPPAESCNAPLTLVALWRRALSAADRSALFADPFCMLRGG